MTRLAGKPTVDDPEGYPTAVFLEIAGILAILSLPLLTLGGWLTRAT